MMRAESPDFLAFLRNNEVSYSGSASQSYPKSIMLHTYYNSNEQAMQQALREGDICETVGPGGKTWYSFDSMQEGHKKSTESTMELHRGNKQEELKALEETMERVDWKQFGSPVHNASSASGARQPFAIADAPKLIKWGSIEATLLRPRQLRTGS